MIRRLIILLLIVGCGTEPEDCAGVAGGTAELDCFGVCGGVAIKDDCGLCTGGTTGLIANYLKDCAGVCGGNTTQEVCDECSSGIFDCEGICDGDAVEDCAGICVGNALEDECGVCDSDATNDCVQDCAGVWGGDATANECEESEDVYGCIDSNAVNYSSNATVSDSTCEYSVYGGYPDFETICAMDEFGNPTTNIGEGICGLCIGERDTMFSKGGLFFVTSLSAPYPNPFDYITSITLSIPVLSNVELYVLDTDYNKIDTLVQGDMQPNSYSITWDATSFPSGYYRIVFDSGNLECFANVQKNTIFGCTDNQATNYNVLADIDDGSCEYRISIDLSMTDDLELTISLSHLLDSIGFLGFSVVYNTNVLNISSYSNGQFGLPFTSLDYDEDVPASFLLSNIADAGTLLTLQFQGENYEGTTIYLSDILIVDNTNVEIILDDSNFSSDSICYLSVHPITGEILFGGEYQWTNNFCFPLNYNP